MKLNSLEISVCLIHLKAEFQVLKEHWLTMKHFLCYGVHLGSEGHLFFAEKIETLVHESVG